MSLYIGYPGQCFITLKVRQLFLVITRESKVLVENQLKPVNLSIPGDGLEGLSHPTYLQAGVCVLQPRQNDRHLLPS